MRQAMMASTFMRLVEMEIERRRRERERTKAREDQARIRRAERYHDMPGGPMILCGGCRLYFMYPEGAPEMSWPSSDRWDGIECPRCRVVGKCEPVV
jgi:hypothetical protein